MESRNIYNQDLPACEANNVPLTPLQFLERNAFVYPDRTAIIHGEQQYTWKEMYARCKKLGHALEKRGIGKGDTVAIMANNCPAHIEVHYGVPFTGAVIAGLNTRLDAAMIAFQLCHSEAKLVLIDKQYSAVMAEALDMIDNKPVVIDIDDPLCDEGELIGECDYEALLAEGDEHWKWHWPENEWEAISMNYTSGTTGDPKGVLHAHRFLYGHLPCMELSQGGFPRRGDIGWTPADWAWIGGLMDMAVPCLFYGVPLISHRFAKFEPEAAYDLMRREGVSNAFIPPTALRMMRQARAPDGLRLRAIGSGGEALGADLLDWARETLHCPINEFYGQTEANLVVAACDGVMDRVPGAMGLAVPGHEVAVLGPGDKPVGAGEVGEVCVAAPDPVMMLRYWNKPEATAKKVVNGWLRTGDLATLTDSGQMVFHARDDDVITSAGYRIGPVEIEQALCSHADVTMAAVVGEPDALRTEIVVAHVVLRAGAEVTDDALKALVREKVSAHVVPRRIVRTESLPMTATGKILRRALRPA